MLVINYTNKIMIFNDYICGWYIRKQYYMNPILNPRTLDLNGQK